MIVYKFKRFVCKSLGGSAGQSHIRIIYAYFPDEKRVDFIEIYFKGDKKNEDQGRIKRYVKTLGPQENKPQGPEGFSVKESRAVYGKKRRKFRRS